MTKTVPNTKTNRGIRRIAALNPVDTIAGVIYNQKNDTPIGWMDKGELRVTSRWDGEKVNVSVNRVIGFKVFGPDALQRGVEIRHIDGDRTNNAIKNLQLVQTPVNRGVLKTDQVRRIRNLASKGFRTYEIAERVGVSRHQVYRTATGRAYSQIAA